MFISLRNSFTCLSFVQWSSAYTAPQVNLFVKAFLLLMVVSFGWKKSKVKRGAVKFNPCKQLKVMSYTSKPHLCPANVVLVTRHWMRLFVRVYACMHIVGIFRHFVEQWVCRYFSSTMRLFSCVYAVWFWEASMPLNCSQKALYKCACILIYTCLYTYVNIVWYTLKPLCNSAFGIYVNSSSSSEVCDRSNAMTMGLGGTIICICVLGHLLRPVLFAFLVLAFLCCGLCGLSQWFSTSICLVVHGQGLFFTFYGYKHTGSPILTIFHLNF